MNLIENNIELNLLQGKDELVVRILGGKPYIFDPIRKKNILLQPEELVRQLMINYLLKMTQFHRNNIQVEKLIMVNNLSRRFDIVVYDKHVKPYILVECKASDIEINQSTFDQIAVYNMALNAPYLVVTNGRTVFCVQTNHVTKSYDFLKFFPSQFGADES